MSARTGWRGAVGQIGARLLIALLWLLHWLPLGVLAWLGQGLGGLLWRFGRSRRRIALKNLELCFPELDEPQRMALGREHFTWLARSLLDRSLMLFASTARLKRLVRVEGDGQLAQRDSRPMMWVLPHFVGLEFAALPVLVFQSRPAVDIYQRQGNPVFDAALLRARRRFGKVLLVDRAQGIRPVIRAIQSGSVFVNAPDMDFGRQDSEFVPFFGVPTNTLLSPARMARSMGMQVQTLVMEMLPGGQGYVAHFGPPPPGFDDPDPLAAATAFNHWLEAQIRRMPAQYLWVHRRFKTRPLGETPVY